MSAILNDLSSVKAGLNITSNDDDMILATLRDSANDAIVQYCRRSFSGGTFTEYFDGGAKLLVLANYPVMPGWELRVDPGRFFSTDSIVFPERVVMRADRGLVTMANGNSFIPGTSPHSHAGAVKISYSTAANDIPESVKHACLELISHWYRQMKTWQATDQQNLKTKTDNGVVTEYPWGQSGGFTLPRGVVQLLAPFRSVSV
jgi:hypothetical protein